ncbi:MAG: protein-L-isoaspartate(D-aspartate) O-methyltransferase [Candidatus Omnitrophica bacterium]|nr:protein-L-isoaspartate(D-aspartate) O-methyltransferase [Candidatus Omnitrophota bacterium]MBU1895196.1 protein-L-isoaspartate(D-aspartate) O-methyltransferase [Candidatus Omnitrophota bacterium]
MSAEKSFSNDRDNVSAKKKIMVEMQIKARGVNATNVLSAMEKVDRHLFVPQAFRENAYLDSPLPIGYGQTISQPYIVAYMTEQIKPQKNMRVLEIGTGCGYQAAVLAEIVKEVYTIEILAPLAEAAKKRLKLLGYNNVTVECADGYKGLPEYAPFDAIIVTAAPPEIPEELIEQLKIGGKMIVPVGTSFQQLYLIERTEEGTKQQVLLPVRFVPMVKSE